MTDTPDKPKDYGELSAPDLAKLINEEYSVVLAGERNTFQQALAIGEKLVWLRAKAAHGEWQKKLKVWCPKLSYETATLYIRLVEKRHIWEPKARAESVEATDLTIEKVRQLLAKSKTKSDSDDDPESDSDADSNSDSDEGEDAVSEGASPGADQIVADLELDTGDMFEVLKKVYDRDELMDITKRLAADLGMVLVLKPPAQTIAPTAAAIAAAAVPAGASFQRKL